MSALVTALGKSGWTRDVDPDRTRPTEQQVHLMEQLTKLEDKMRMIQEVRPEFAVFVPGEKPTTHSDLDEALPGSPPSFRSFDPKSNQLHRLLLRGIAVHHAGLPKQYRQAVERLFRMRRLGIVFSTSTLAVGINMPSKTSVFAGDSLFLNSMLYQQEAGRAGRRGFDLRGHTVFFGIRREKVEYLIRSELPMLQGHLVVTPSMVLRLLIHESTTGPVPKGKSGAGAIRRLLENPFLETLELMPLQLAHFFRFCVEYLRRERIVNEDLAPSDLAGFIAHIFWTEPANFAFSALLQAGVFEELCAKPLPKEALFIVLCHLFCTLPLSQWQCEAVRTRPSHWSPSVVVLPELPAPARVALQEHNRRALERAVEYLRQFAVAFQKELGEDDALPLSRARIGPPRSRNCDCRPQVQLQPSSSSAAVNHVRSAFVATSGHGDVFHSLSELCGSLRSGLFLDPGLVPVMDLPGTTGAGSTTCSGMAGARKERPSLNAYLLDFFRHGQTKALERCNRIAPSDLWTKLEDFGFILRALAAAIERRSMNISHQKVMTAFADPRVVAVFQAVTKEFDAKWASVRGRWGEI